MSGRGPLAVGIVTGLLHSGIGTVHTDTGGTVRGGDLGTGYVDAERGAERLTATQAAVRRLLPEAPYPGAAAARVPDLVVLADEMPEPARVAALRAERRRPSRRPPARRHRRRRPARVPGRTACLGCLDLTRGDLEPRWPAVAAQLAGRAGVADPACATATVGLAVAQAVAAIEAGRPGRRSSATLELDVATGRLRRRVWSAHPDCPCGAGNSPSRSRISARGDTIMR